MEHQTPAGRAVGTTGVVTARRKGADWSFRQWIGLFACLLAVALLWVGVVWMYVGKSDDYDQLLAENRMLRLTVERQNTRLQMLDRTVDRIGVLSEKLKQIAGIYDPQRRISIGPVDAGRADVPGGDIYAFLNIQAGAEGPPGDPSDDPATLRERERDLNFLYEFFRDRRLILNSYPSIMPTRGWMTSGFGSRSDPITGRRSFHEGIDINAPIGTPVVAAAEGVVIFAGTQSGYGKVVAIDHGFGMVTRYGHCAALYVSVGERVERWQRIAAVGTSGRVTGPHLHYEVRIDNVPQNPLKFILK